MPQAQKGPNEADARAAHQRGGGMEAQVQVPVALSVHIEGGGIGTHMSFTPLARAGRKYEASVSLSCLCTVVNRVINTKSFKVD